MITIKNKVNQYRKPTGIVLVYSLTGEEKELKAYEKAVGENFRKSDAGEPLFFSRTPLSAGQAVVPTRDNSRYVVQTDLEAEVERKLALQEKEEARIAAMQNQLGMSKEEILRAILAA